jgi:protein-tyrosine phosphatase
MSSISDVEAHEVAPKFWVGSYPTTEAIRNHFDAVVLCAVELQSLRFNGIPVIRAPFNDDTEYGPTPREINIALTAARRVQTLRQSGKRVLVTCAQGINRSSFVAALAMMMDGNSATIVIDTIRERRHPPIELTPLFNEHFQKFLYRFEASNQLFAPRTAGINS